MPLAVLLDAIGKSAQAPIFLLLDLAAFAFDDGFEMGGKCVHRLRADVLARDQEMLVKSHVRSLFWLRSDVGRTPGTASARRTPAALRATRKSGRPATAAA